VALGVAALYGLAPQVLGVFEQLPRVETIGWFGLGAMVVLEACSFAAVWRLQRIAMPDLSWFASATSQLTANAVSRSVPGGAAVGAGISLRMWSMAGVDTARAAGALTGTSLISTGTLLALPLVSLAVAAFGAPVPQNLFVVAIGGGIVSLALFSFGVTVMTSRQTALRIAELIHRFTARVGRRFDHPGVAVDDLMDRRSDLLAGLGTKWRDALAASVANWGFDYLALVAALVLLDANPRFSLVLVAYGAAALLTMIPITPGGLGFVEAGLASLLVVAGIPGPIALLATLAYRIVSFWLPLPAGLVAWLLFRRRFSPGMRIEALAATGAASPPP
jgi:hypothetical protein